MVGSIALKIDLKRFAVRSLAASVQCVLLTAALLFTSDALAQSLETDSSSYARGDSLTATWSDLEDIGFFSYVAMALVDSGDSTHLDYFNMDGDASGSVVFSHLSASCGLELRVYRDTSSTEVLYRSEPFEVDCDPSGYGTVVAPLSGDFLSSDDPTFTWADGPGFRYDWVGIAVAGEPDSSYISWDYTSSDFSGPYDGSFAYSDLTYKAVEVLPIGNYEVRYYVNDSFEVAARADFRIVLDPSLVFSASVTTDDDFYTPREAVVLNWDGAPGNALDWTGLSLKRLSQIELSSYTDIYGEDTWQYTSGFATGVHTYTNIKELGQYAARGFVDNTYAPFANQAEFEVNFNPGDFDPEVAAAVVSVDSDVFFKGEPITVSFEGATGSADDILLIAQADEDPDVPGAVEEWTYFDQAGLEGATSGSHTFYPFLPLGRYIARGMHADSWTPMGSSIEFEILFDPAMSPIVYSTPTCVASDTEQIAIGYRNVSGPPNGTWIGIWPEGADRYSFSESWVYTPFGVPAAEGFLCFSGTLVDEGDPLAGCAPGTLPEGRYELRVMNQYRRIGETSVFDVSDSCPEPEISTSSLHYQLGDTVTINWDMMETNPDYRVGPLPNGTAVPTVSVETAALASGSADVVADVLGDHTAVAFHQYTDIMVGTSERYIVCPVGEVPDCEWICTAGIEPFECPPDPTDSGDPTTTTGTTTGSDSGMDSGDGDTAG